MSSVNSPMSNLNSDQLIASIITTPKENLLRKGEPQCIKEITNDPMRDPLPREEAVAAHKELTQYKFVNLQFPRTRKLRTDPDLLIKRSLLLVLFHRLELLLTATVVSVLPR